MRLCLGAEYILIYVFREGHASKRGSEAQVCLTNSQDEEFDVWSSLGQYYLEYRRRGDLMEAFKIKRGGFWEDVFSWGMGTGI